MRFTTLGLLAITAMAAAREEAFAYGRGGVVRAGAAVGPRGAAVGTSRGGVAVGPYGGVHAGGAQHGTYVGPRGTTVQAGRAGGVGVGPAGGVRAGGASGVKVTTPGGRSYTDVNRAGVGVGPAGGVRVGASGRTTAVGPYGGFGTGYRGGVAVGPYGGAVGAVRVGAVGHSTAYYGHNYVRTAAVGVRTGYYPYFNAGWYTAHTTAWVAPRWVAGYNLWVPPVWGTIAPFVGVTSTTPADYDYGSTIVINDNSVYINGQSAGTAEDYAAQADTLANAGRQAKPADTDEFQPLGVFGLIQPDEKVAQRIFQLAVNKAGVIRGNYYDAVADTTTPVYGSVDPKSQRAAWSIGEKKDIVFEAGLGNLTQQEATALVHYGKERTEQMILARLEETPAKK